MLIDRGAASSIVRRAIEMLLPERNSMLSLSSLASFVTLRHSTCVRSSIPRARGCDETRMREKERESASHKNFHEFAQRDGITRRGVAG